MDGIIDDEEDFEYNFESLTTSWIGSEFWLQNAVGKLNEDYRILRRDIKSNSNCWSYTEYCERIAYHYYNLGSFYNDIYNNDQINIQIIKNYLEKCLRILNSIPHAEYTGNTERLRTDAEHHLHEIKTNIKTIGRKRNDLIRKKNVSNKERRDYLKLCVLLDDTDDEKFTECVNRWCGEYKKDLGRKIQNIQLLKIISELENAISFYDNENDFQLVHLSDRLSRAYKLTGQDLLSKEYEKASQRLFLKFSTEQTAVVDNKNRIKTTILNEIREHNSSLEQVISYIEEDVHVLNNIDRNYIERKYLKYSSNLWLEETGSFIKKQLELKNRGIIDIIITSLDAVQNLNQIPNPLNQLKYYQLLDKHHNLIDEKNEKDILDGFKKTCLEELRNRVESFDKEMEFLNAFIDFISSIQNVETVSAGLKLKKFCSNPSLTELLDDVMKLEVDNHDDKLIILKKAIDGLERDDTFFIEDKLKEVITSYLKPAEVQERKENNRFVIEARARNVTISKILPSIESKLSKNQSVEEIHIIGIDIIHVDANLKNEIWHGKNIVVYTKKIKVVDKIVWDVSGVNNNHEYADDAGTDEDGHGKNGADGYAGESGGNVLILTETAENEENFTIISNGGNGGTGQNGGNGKIGENGKGMTVSEFKTNYSSFVKFVHNPGATKSKEELVSKLTKSKNIETNWRENGHVFIETLTDEGNKIIFSYCSGTRNTNRQAFLLHKGSLGRAGGTGGECGLGGLGGYAGEIVVVNPKNINKKFNVVEIIKNGKDGEMGKGGVYGQHGDSGWDMGYTDYQYWSTWVLHGQNKNSRCKLEYFNGPTKNRIWCPYEQKYADIITVDADRNVKQFEERNDRQNNDRRPHSRAVRKKTISKENILNDYSRHFNRIEQKIVQDLHDDLEKIQRPASAAIDKNKGQEKKTMLLTNNFRRKVEHFDLTSRKNKTKIPHKNIGKFISKLKMNPRLSGDWFYLKYVQMNRSEFDQIYSLFETRKNQKDINRKVLSNIEKILLEKYRLIVHRDIANDLTVYQNETVHEQDLTPENLAEYLVETEEKISSHSSHDALGTFSQYFYTEDNDARRKISEYFKKLVESDKSYEENHREITRALSTFVYEVGNSMGVDGSVEKYFEEHVEFVRKRKSYMNIFSRALADKLERSRNIELFSLWSKSSEDESSMSALEEKIKNQDSFTKALYNRCRNAAREYDWNKCCRDENVLSSFDKRIRERGPLSESYRELLSFIYDINIVVYDKTRNDTFHLRDNHNPSSEQKLYVSYEDGEFSKLRVNEDYLKLVKERYVKNNIYATILSDLEITTEKSKLDDYYRDKTFLSDERNRNRYSFSDVGGEHEIDNIVKYFPKNDRQLLKKRLEKITGKYIEHEGILRTLSKRFYNEGAHIDSQIIYYLIDAMIRSFVENGKEQNIFYWIVASYPQQNWIDQIIIIQIENHFRNLLTKKSEWLEYLSNVRDKNILLSFGMKLNQCKLKDSISIECIDTTLYLLSRNLELTVDLDQLELFEWSYALKENYWSHRLNQLAKWNKNDLTKASYYLSSVENIFGTILVEKFINILENKRDVSTNVLNVTLSNFYNETWNLGEDELKILSACDVKPWMRIMDDKFHIYGQERGLDQLIELIRNRDDVSQEIKTELSTIKDSIENMHELSCTRSGKLIKEFTISDVKDWTKKFKENLVGLKDDDERKRFIVAERIEVLAVVDRAIYLTKSFKLRNTQKLSVLTLLAGKRNALAQISTGEGKSLIVVSLAIIKALCFEKIDIVTSSSVLAIRDAENHRDVYGVFDLSVSHNCNEDIEKRKEAYSSNQIVYGELSNFQRDYLLDKFYGKNILGDRHFENVIVDEVDSMLLDKGNNMLYLSHDLVGFDKIESVYIYIWQWINQPANDRDSISQIFDSDAIKESVLNELYRTLNKNDIKTLDSNLSQQQVDVIWYRLIEKGILDHKGKLLRENLYAEEMDEIFSFDLRDYKARFGYLFRERNGREMNICVPNYLKPFIELHLEAWIENALNAFFMKPGTSYVVDVDRTGNNQDRTPNIRILDRDTGTDQTNSQWNEALHQFLQLKHGCKISLQSLKAVFISNVSFLKQYECLYGLTGTLGSQIERDLLQQVHQVDFITIPTAKSKQFYEDSPIVCLNQEEWTNHICDETIKTTEIKRRSVLIICETINEAEVLHKAFMFRGVKNVHKYTRDYEEFDVGRNNEELTQGQIIIATNLAGRGTDIKITGKLKEAGGLHVFLTYLPNNIRIEQQAFGRAARCGDEGSGRLIVMDSNAHRYHNLRILNLKIERDVKELHRISNVKTYYETQITTEEKCFKIFQKHYERLKKALVKLPAELKTILLNCCLDKWAFWLDKNGSCISSIKNNKKKIVVSTIEFLSNLKKLEDVTDWSDWIDGCPTHTIQLGVYYVQNKNQNRAIELFDEVIKREGDFSEAAHYYKAYALSKTIDWQRKICDAEILMDFKNELRDTAMILRRRNNFCLISAACIHNNKEINKNSIMQIDAYEKQQKNFSDLYSIFLKSIDDITGHHVTPELFINSGIDEELAEILYDDLLEEDILGKPKMRNDIDRDVIDRISSSYGTSTSLLRDFLDGYRGKEIDEIDFQKSMKNNIALPNRETFWKLLMKEKVLIDEIKYVIIDDEKLKKIDPSLINFINTRTNDRMLKKENFEFDNDEIILYAENIPNASGNVFVKSVFIEAVGKNKYALLKKKNVFTFNKKARVDVNKIDGATLSFYDAVILDDFIKLKICENEAELIVDELVAQRVIEMNRENGDYHLIIEYPEIEHIRLSFPIYERPVKIILSTRFAYRIALQKIKKQITENRRPLKIKLETKPHRRFFWELIEEKIIEPVHVICKEELETKLRTIYKTTLDENDLKHVLFHNSLIPEDYTIFAQLVKKQWIVPAKITDSIKTIIKNEYIINDPEKRQKLQNCFADVETTLELIFNNRLKLTKENTLKIVAKSLEEARSLLIALHVPDFNLKPLKEFPIVEGLEIFILDGMSQVIQAGEMKWTRQMLFNTGCIIILGLAQMIAGYLMTLYSCGVMAEVGEFLIVEGGGDLMFAYGLIESGYFSWESYIKYKLKSMVTSAVTFSIGRFLKDLKLIERNSKLAETRGVEVAEKVGLQETAVNVIKETSVKVGKTVVNNILCKNIDMLVHKYAQTFCEHVGSTLLSNIEETIKNYKISSTLRNMYDIYGEKDAEIIVNDLTDKVFSEKENFKNFINFAVQAGQILIRGIKTNNKESCDDIWNYLGSMLDWVDRFKNINDIKKITDFFLNNLNEKMNDVIRGKTRRNVRENNFEIFKNNVIDVWTTKLRAKAGNIIETNILKPLIETGVPLITKKIEKLCTDVHNDEKNKYGRLFKITKRNFKANKPKVTNKTNPKYGNTEVIKYIHDEHHNNLLRLLQKTNNPDIFADIIDENIKMNFTCAEVAVRILSHKYQKPFILLIESDNQTKQEFKHPFDADVRNAVFLPIKFKNNHFDLWKDEWDEDGQNNSLYAAVKRALSDFDLSPQQFRKEISNFIRRDRNTREHIENGWHKLPVTFGVRCGSTKEDDSTGNETREIFKTGKILYSQNSIDVRRRESNFEDLNDGVIRKRSAGNRIEAERKNNFVMFCSVHKST